MDEFHVVSGLLIVGLQGDRMPHESRHTHESFDSKSCVVYPLKVNADKNAMKNLSRLLFL